MAGYSELNQRVFYSFIYYFVTAQVLKVSRTSGPTVCIKCVRKARKRRKKSTTGPRWLQLSDLYLNAYSSLPGGKDYYLFIGYYYYFYYYSALQCPALKV